MILSKYIISSILKVAIVTILMFTLLLAAVELFMKIDSILSNNVSILSLSFYILLTIPQYFLMVSSVAFLFSVTYFFSMLSANNEKIALLNAGLSDIRIKRPVLILAIVLTLLASVFQEKVVIQANTLKSVEETELFGSSSTRDTRNIVLLDSDGYLIYTTRYSESRSEIVDPVLIKYEGDEIILRIDAKNARFSEDEGYWIFYNVKLHEVKNGSVAYEKLNSWYAADFDIEPRLFRSQNLSIDTMDRKTAIEYLETLKINDRITWQVNATDYYRRVFMPFALFILIFISLSMNYSFKKNVFLFSMIQSLSIAVVYYVVDMVTTIMGHQALISPFLVVALPVLAVVIVSVVFAVLGRKL